MSSVDHNSQIRKENYDLFLKGNAAPPVQRIFDAFIRKYPDAQITGISVQDNGQRLLVYLDGNPAYYATYNPLTNFADLEVYIPVATEKSAPVKNLASISAERGNTLSCVVSLLSLIYGLIVFMTRMDLSSIIFGCSALIALIASACDKGGIAIVFGALMVFSGLLGSYDLVVPGLLVIYGGTKF